MSENPEKTSTAALDGLCEELPEIAVRIMRAAIHLFARKGYAATSVREIVQEAQVTNPMLYYYFEGKEGLFVRLLDMLMGEFDRKNREILEADTSLRQKLEAIADTHLQAAGGDEEIVRFIYTIVFGPRDSRPPYDIYEHHLQMKAGFVAMFEKAIASGEFVPADPDYTPAFLTEMLLSLLERTMLRTLKEIEWSEPDQRDAVVEANTGPRAKARILTFFLKGAGQLPEETP